MSSKHFALGHPAYKNPSEDRIIVHEDLNGNKIYSVFDGHSGQRCVSLVSETLPKNIMGHLSLKYEATPEQIGELLKDHFGGMEELCNQVIRYFDGGTTAVVSVVTKTHIITAHVGDSPALLFSKEGEYLASTLEHDAKNPSEVLRVEAEGGWFGVNEQLGDNRLYGTLSITRAFGDTIYKVSEKGLIAVPEITIWERKPNTYLALFSDSFTEKEIDNLRGDRDSNGNLLKVIANRRTHQEIAKEFADALQKYNYSIEETVPYLVHTQTMKFYDQSWGMYCGDNTSLILIEL